MTKEDEIYEKLTTIFRDVFMDDEIILTAKTTANDIEDWDSLMHITLIAEVETCFNIKFDSKTVEQLNNVGEMVNYICVQIGG